MSELHKNNTQNERPVYCNRFLFNNQQDALIIQIYSVIKIYMFVAYSLPILRSFSTVHLALVGFMHVFDDCFQAESGWNCSSILTLLGSGHEIYQCRM